MIALGCALSITAHDPPARAQPIDGGWYRHDVSRAGVEIAAIACSRRAVYAMSSTGQVQRWDGDAWAELPPPPMRDRHPGPLAVSPDDHVLVGEHSSVLHWDGQRWRTVVADRAVTSLWASGGEVYATARGAIELLVDDRMRAYDAGTWRDLASVWSSGPRDVFVAGDAGTLMHHDGTRWSRAQAGIDADLRGVWGSGPSDVWVWGGEQVAHWDGRTWTRRDATQGVLAIGGAAPDHVYALTYDGASVWTGQGWREAIRRDALGPGYHTLEGVCATDREIAIASRRAGVITSRRLAP